MKDLEVGIRYRVSVEAVFRGVDREDGPGGPSETLWFVTDSGEIYELYAKHSDFVVEEVRIVDESED